MSTFLTMVVPVKQVQLARDIAAALDAGGVGMWTTELSKDGAAPATHYVSTGFVGDGWMQMVPVASYEWSYEQDADGAWVKTGQSDGDAQAVVDACAAADLTVTLKQVKALYAACDITQQDPWTAFSRLGLQLVETAAETDAEAAV